MQELLDTLNGLVQPARKAQFHVPLDESNH